MSTTTRPRQSTDPAYGTAVSRKARATTVAPTAVPRMSEQQRGWHQDVPTHPAARPTYPPSQRMRMAAPASIENKTVAGSLPAPLPGSTTTADDPQTPRRNASTRGRQREVGEAGLHSTVKGTADHDPLERPTDDRVAITTTNRARCGQCTGTGSRTGRTTHTMDTATTQTEATTCGANRSDRSDVATPGRRYERAAGRRRRAGRAASRRSAGWALRTRSMSSARRRGQATRRAPASNVNVTYSDPG